MLDKFIIKFLSLFIFNSKKRKEFRNNFYIKKQIKMDKKYRKMYNMGFGSYANEKFYVANPKETVIGKYCSIANEVCLGLTQHPVDYLTTHGFIANRENPRFEGKLDVYDNAVNYQEEKLKPPIIIGNDVWIGYRAVIMDGVKIGDGAVIAACSVVTKDVEPYTIVAGVPAKPVKRRFDGIIGGGGVPQKLVELRWWDYPVEFIRTLPFADVGKCIKILEENKHLKSEKTCANNA